MKTVQKRALSWLLTLCIMLSLVPTTALTAQAAETEELAAALAEVEATTGLASGNTTIITSRPADGILLKGHVLKIESNTPMTNLSVAPGVTAVIYIATGKTLTATGGTGKAGINVPQTSTLVLVGGGSLVAQGGNAAKGGKGGNGTNATIWDAGRDIAHTGAGGAGGKGGVGAGAGIGGNGGAGGKGADGVGARSVYYNTDSPNDSNSIFNGTSGTKGNNGIIGDTMGTLYVLGTVNVKATGGEPMEGGGSGSAGGEAHDLAGSYWWRGVTGGAGGGGGGGGGRAMHIGGGGGGGGGGGAGGGGTVAMNSKQNARTEVYLGSGGGGGGDSIDSWKEGGAGGKAATITIISSGQSGGTAHKGDDGQDGNFLREGGRPGYSEISNQRGSWGGNGGAAKDKGGAGNFYKAPGAVVTGRTGATSATTQAAVEYNVTLEHNNKEAASNITATFGLTMPNVTPPTKPGSEFLGYFDSADNTDVKYYDEYGKGLRTWEQFSNDVKLYAHWKAREYTVTLHPNGGSGGGTVAAQYNETLIAPGFGVPTRPGYTFTGYNTDKDGSGLMMYDAQQAPQGVFGATESQTYYAIWKSKTYDIELHSVDGYVTTIENVKYGELRLPNADDLRIAGTPIDRLHYNFVGWNVYDAQNWAMFEAGKVYKTGLTEEPTAYLYAAWQPVDQFTVTYNPNGGSGGPAQADVFSGDDHIIAADVPTRENYVFLGWGDSPGALPTDTLLQGGNTLTAVTSNRILYAIWKAKPIVSYNANGGVGAPDRAYYAPGDTADVNFSPLPTRQGYAFAGWDIDQAATTPTYIAGQTTSFTMPDSNVTLYAIWAPAKLTITYTDDGKNAYTYHDEAGTGTAPATTNYGVNYSFSVLLPSSVNGSGLVVSVNGVAQSTPTPTDVTGDKLYVYHVVGPTVDQTVTVSGYSAQSYNVALQLNGGKFQASPPGSYTHGVGLTLPTDADVKRDGHTFGGWYDNEGLNDPAVTEIAGTETGDKTFYAKWTANGYTIKFDANCDPGGTGTMDDIAATYGTSVQLTSNDYTHPSGYDFLGWSTDPDAVELGWLDGETVQDLAESGEITLYAVWKVASFTVSYSANGGTWTDGGPDARQYKEGVDVGVYFPAADSLTRTGYAFLGWAETADATAADYAEGVTAEITGIDANHALYAVWGPATYTVEFNGNTSLDAAMSDLELTYGTPTALTANTYTLSGKHFLGWSTAQGATAPSYLDGQTVLNLTATDGETITLYAVWGDAPVIYLSYDANGGSWENNAPGMKSVTSGDNVQVQFGDVPTKTGYTFKGWRLDVDNLYVGGETISVTANTTLYAEWKANAYTVTFHDKDGKLTATQTLTYDTPAALDENVENVQNYKFLGWAVNENGRAAYQDEQSVLNLTTEAGAEIKLYAVWEPSVTFILSYNTNGGSGGPGSVLYAGGDLVTVEKDNLPIRPGYIFMGWSKGANDSTVDYPVGTPADFIISASTTLYAIWDKAPTHTVQYDANKGAGSVPVDINAYPSGSSVAVSFGPLPYRQGYTFIGWAESESATGPKYTQSGTSGIDSITEHMILYAVWQANTYKVVFHHEAQTEEQAMTYGKDIALRANTFTAPAGHTFAGWATVPGGGVAFADRATVENLTNAENGEIHLYAAWTAATSTITLDFDGGTGGTDSVQATYGQPMPTGGLIGPTQAGHIFGGYYAQADGQGKQYYSSDMQSVTDCDFAVATTLYAKWTAMTYDIRYYQDTKELQKSTIPYGTEVTLPGVLSGMTIGAGEKLLGWSKQASGSSIDYAPGASIADNSLWNNGSPVSLYAVVKRDERYTLSYAANGGERAPDSQRGLYAGVLVAVNMTDEPVKEGFAFQGWSQRARADTPDTGLGKDNTTKAPAQLPMPSENVILHAIWSPIKYTIKYYDGNADLNRDQEVAYDAKSHSFDNGAGIVKEGNNLLGWSTSKHGTVNHDLDAKMRNPLSSVDGDEVPLYAVWEKNPYEITYDVNGGTGTNRVTTITYGGQYSSFPTTSREGYTLAGWYRMDGNTKTTVSTGSVMNVARPHTVYADWAPFRYGIGFHLNGGTGTAPTDGSAYAVGESIALPSGDGLSGGNRIFSGWSTDQAATAGQTGSYTLQQGDVRNGKITFYAVWRASNEVTYKVEHYQQSADQSGYALASTESLSAAPGTSVTAVAGSFAGFTYHAGHADEVKSGTLQTGQALVLKLYYDRDTYTVTLDTQGGTVNTGAIAEYVYGVGAALPTDVEKAGYAFAGWYTDPGGAGAQITAITAGDVGDKTFYAKWSASTTAYAVNHYQQALDGSYPTTPTEHERKIGATGAQTTAVAKSYEGFATPNVVQTTILADGSAEVALYYTRNSYRLTFNPDNGGAPTVRLVKFDAAIAPPANPIKAHHTFDGWGTVAAKMPAADTTYMASWTPVKYAVTDQTDATVTIGGLDAGGYAYGAICTFTATAGGGESLVVYANGSVLALTGGGYAFTVTGATTITAKVITANKLDVSYSANGGTGSVPVDATEYDSGNSATVAFTPAPTREGYVFLGWAVTDNAASPAYTKSGITSFNVVANTILYAVWKSVGLDQSSGYTGIYDGESHAISVAVSGVTPTGYQWEKGNVEISGATEATLSVKDVADSGDYTCTVTYDGGSLTSPVVPVTITPATVTVTAEDKTVTYGEDAPAYTYSYAGLQGRDTEATLNLSPVVACTYTKGDRAQDYGITLNVSGLAASNYVFHSADGILTVARRQLNISWPGKNSFEYATGTVHRYVPTLSGGLPGDTVSLNLTGNTSAQAAGNYTVTVIGLSGTDAGNYTLPSTGLAGAWSITGGGDPGGNPGDNPGGGGGGGGGGSGGGAAGSGGDAPLTPGQSKPNAPIILETNGKKGTSKDYLLADRLGNPLEKGREVYVGQIDEKGWISIVSSVLVNDKSSIRVTLPSDGSVVTLLDPMSFEDVGKGDWFFRSVQHVYYNDLMQGTGPITYEPGTLTNRAMVATLLYRVSGAKSTGATGFSDVRSGLWYSDSIGWAAKNGYANGYSDGLFHPEEVVTREQMATLLHRFAGAPSSSQGLEQFADADQISAYAVPAVRWAVEQGLLTGKSNGILDPTGYATRAELAGIIARYLGLV